MERLTEVLNFYSENVLPLIGRARYTEAYVKLRDSVVPIFESGKIPKSDKNYELVKDFKELELACLWSRRDGIKTVKNRIKEKLSSIDSLLGEK